MGTLACSPAILPGSLSPQSKLTTARVWLVAFACVAAFLCGLRAAEGASYSFTAIAQTGGEFSNLSSPSINNSGVVAFRAFPSVGGEVIYKGDGASLVPMLDTLGNIRTFSRPIISDSGSVVVEAGTGIVGTPGSGSGLFLADGVSVTTLIDTSGPYTGFGIPSINSSDVVVSYATSGGTSSIIQLHGTTVTTLYDTSGPFTSVGTPRLNDAGEVAFLAGLGPGGFDGAIYRGDGGTPTLIADASGPFNGNFGYVDVNNNGTVVFWADLDSGVRGLFTGDGVSTTTVVDSTGAFPVPGAEDFFRLANINSEDTVAFELGGAEGIYTGPDPLLDKVIAPGDSLFDSTVVRAGLGGTGHSLNDQGQIAFWAELANGTYYILRATPEPVSTPVALDIKPRRCPNRINFDRKNKKDKVTAAINGTNELDVSQLDPASIRLAGVAPRRSRIRDVGTPYLPFTGKQDPHECHVEGPDGFEDLVFKFGKAELCDALGDVQDHEVRVLKLTGSFKEEYGGGGIVGEDVVIFRHRRH